MVGDEDLGADGTVIRAEVRIDDDERGPAMFTFTDPDGVTIHVYEWLPERQPRAIVLISHGLGEHAGRYEPFAGQLVDAGYAVYAADQRGHGLSVHGEQGDFGPEQWDGFVEDIHRLNKIARKKFPGVPVVLFGHSMGSAASQLYAIRHSNAIQGLILSGTAAFDKVFTSELLADPSLNPLLTFNDAFDPPRTGFEWLSRDEAEVDKYVADPLCGFGLVPDSMKALVGGAKESMDVGAVRADLPICIAVGDADPVNADLAYSDLLRDRYRDAGIADLTYLVYPGARHEILNETNRDEVIGDVLTWLAERIVD